MDQILALLLSCSLHLDDALLRGVVDAFSAGNAFAVLDAAGLDEDTDDLPPRSSSEAQIALARITALGGAPVMGVLPVRPEWLAELDKPLESLFDACQQVAIATAKLSEFDYQCRQLGLTPVVRARRSCTLEHYGASLGLPALGRFVMVQLDHSVPSSNEDTPPQLDESLFHPGGLFFGGGAP